MTASGRTPVGDPSADQVRDSGLGLPRTYVRTDGDELVKRDNCALVSSARETRKSRLLDLFCGAGGCSAGYARAGFDVQGVDNEDHPKYPFPLLVADAMRILGDVDYLRTFDVIHASPPCQAFTAYRRRGDGVGDSYPDLRPVSWMGADR